ncbi:MAG TPA: carboxymuconolactone decarboxylase family protein [Caulobacteraceae bacterium]
MPDENAYEEGLDIRRQMWGEDGADKRIAAASGFNRPFEDFVTEYCFGKVWGRSELDHKTRSMLTIAILAVLSRPNQLRSHVQGAIKNGVTPEEIREVLIHVMIYGGVPAAADSFMHAREVLKDLGLDK